MGEIYSYYGVDPHNDYPSPERSPAENLLSVAPPLGREPISLDIVIVRMRKVPTIATDLKTPSEERE